MILNWYKTFNKDEFYDSNLISRTDTFELDIGSLEMTIFRGNEFSIKVNDVLLAGNLNDKNPFVFEGYGIYLDDNEDIWIGVTP